jgi:glycosyltransferase involved in cell wall biosynthesis
MLVVSIDDQVTDLALELRGLIADLGLESDVVVVGSIWDILPTLYAVTDIFCTPSVVEGFGMTAQEAAATSVPVVASDGVPFATEYLLGKDIKYINLSDSSKLPLKLGEGAIVVPKDDVKGFASALSMLLDNEELRHNLGAQAYQITIPDFTWEQVTKKFLQEAGFPAN